MADRLTPAEEALLALDTPQHPAQVGSVLIVDGSIDHRQLAELVAERLDYVPRHRMRPRHVPFNLAAPVWSDDTDFTVSGHLRRVALPRPGGMAELSELVARELDRRLDPARSPWQLLVVEGLLLAGREHTAVVLVHHLLLVDGLDHVALEQVLTDEGEFIDPLPSGWEPAPAPSDNDLLVQTATELSRDPVPVLAAGLRRQLTSGLGTLVTVTDAVDRARGGAGWAAVVDGVAQDLMTGAPADPTSPLRGRIGGPRRMALLDLDRAPLELLGQPQQATVDEVLLAVLAAAVQGWLRDAGVPIDSLTLCAPIAEPDDGDGEAGLGLVIRPRLVRLSGTDVPELVGQVVAQRPTAETLSERSMAQLPGLVAATVHAMAARAGQRAGGGYDLLVSRAAAPATQQQLAGVPLQTHHPLPVLLGGHLLGIASTVSGTGVTLTLLADAGLPDPASLATAVSAALDGAASAFTPSETDHSEPVTRGY